MNKWQNIQNQKKIKHQQKNSQNKKVLTFFHSTMYGIIKRKDIMNPVCMYS